MLVSFLPTIKVWRGLHPSIRRSIRSRGRYTITDITQVGNTDLQFGGLFGRYIYRLRSSLFGYSWALALTRSLANRQVTSTPVQVGGFYGARNIWRTIDERYTVNGPI